MTIVERYHSRIRRAFEIIRKKAFDKEREYAFQMAVKAVKDSVSPDGLVPALLIFGALSRLCLPNDGPTDSALKRAVTLRKETTALWKSFASRQNCDALKTQNGPDVQDIHKTAVGALALVYRPEKTSGRERIRYSIFKVKISFCSHLKIRQLS